MAYVKMYSNDAGLPRKQRLWKNGDELAACCRARSAGFEMVIAKMERIEKTA